MFGGFAIDRDRVVTARTIETNALGLHLCSKKSKSSSQATTGVGVRVGKKVASSRVSLSLSVGNGLGHVSLDPKK